MPSLLEAYEMANNTTFINRVSQAVAVCADTVRQEPDNTPLHAERLALANRVMQDANAYGYRFARMVSTNGTISANAPNEEDVPDGDIQYVVNQLWNSYLDA